MNNINFKSQIGQDKLVLKLLGDKKNGTFVDIGCSTPIDISNTFVFEKDFDYRGIGIDIMECKDPSGETWETCRPNTKVILSDALQINYSELFKNNNLPQTIDYLTLDLEPPDLTLECLYKIPFDEYTFNVITFETDAWRDGGHRRLVESRKHFNSNGYILIANLGNQDDVYIHNSFKPQQ